MRHAWARHRDGRVYVAIAGTRPTPSYVVKLAEQAGEAGPASLVLNLVWRNTGTMCHQSLYPYSYGQWFSVGDRRVTTVRIEHESGAVDVPVRDAPAVAVDATAADAEEYTGTSRGSFDEAYRAAAAQARSSHPDELITLEVVRSGGVLGGFAGEPEVSVTVRRVNVPATIAPRRARAAANGRSECSAVEYAAEQVPEVVSLHAYGEHPTTGWRTFFEQQVGEDGSPEFHLVCIPPPGAAADVITPFHARTMFRAEGIMTLTVHDGQGTRSVLVEQAAD